MSTNSLLVLLLIFVGDASASPVSSTPPKDLELSTLSESKIAIVDLSFSTQAGKTFLAGTIIDAPMKALCSLVLDYPRYPAFMPNTDKAQVIQTAVDHTLVDMTLKLPLGKIKKYRLRMQSSVDTAACKLSWTMVPRKELTADETIADTVGSWKLTPHPADSRKTVVQYFVYSDPGPVPFGLGWIVDALGKDSLPKTLEALRGKVQQK